MPEPTTEPAAVPDPLDEAAIGAAVENALAAIAAATTLDELKTARLAHTGEKSPLSLANREIGGLAKEFKAAAGKLMGGSRGRVAKALAARTEVLEAEDAARILVEETVDVTAAPRRRRAGARHPLSTLQDRVCDIFVGMGWEIAEGPELESEWFNFDALNFAPDHPAREMQDTFFVEPPEAHLLLRTHTSPVQVRSLLERELPVYVLCPGKVFRTDELDATHTPVFHQFEGLAIDKEPVLQPGVPQDLLHYADPMPQALVLTAIVIGFAMTALFLVVLLASRGISGTDHVDGSHSRDVQEMP